MNSLSASYSDSYGCVSKELSVGGDTDHFSLFHRRHKPLLRSQYVFSFLSLRIVCFVGAIVCTSVALSIRAVMKEYSSQKTRQTINKTKVANEVYARLFLCSAPLKYQSFCTLILHAGLIPLVDGWRALPWKGLLL